MFAQTSKIDVLRFVQRVERVNMNQKEVHTHTDFFERLEKSESHSCVSSFARERERERIWTHTNTQIPTSQHTHTQTQTMKQEGTEQKNKNTTNLILGISPC